MVLLLVLALICFIFGLVSTAKFLLLVAVVLIVVAAITNNRRVP